MTHEFECGDLPPWNTDDTCSAVQAEPDSTLFDRLRTVERDCGAAGKVDRLIALISACIVEGVTAEGQIIAVLRGLGYDRKFVGAVLNGSAGSDPDRHHWRKDKGKTFSLIDRQPRAPVSAKHIAVPLVCRRDTNAGMTIR